MSARDVIADCLKQLRRPGARTTDAGDAAFVTAALAAAGYVVERGWQTIESAPRDGGRFLFTNGTDVMGIGHMLGKSGTIFAADSWQGSHQTVPTHWRPLPAPPAAEAEAKGAVE